MGRSQPAPGPTATAGPARAPSTPPRSTVPSVPRPLRVLSLGAGVQSSAVLLMSLAGELEPLDAAIFADTGWEPRAVYEHLERLEKAAAEAGVPVYRVGKPVGIREATLDPSSRFASIPFYVRNPDGSAGRARRQCTNEFKIEPIRSQLWKLHQDRSAAERRELRRAGLPGIVQWFGISFDELERMKASDAAYIANHYPLVDRRVTRRGCLEWLRARGWTAPRSACVGCPFHSDAEWRRLRAEDPPAWLDAVAFDHAIRQGDPGRPGLGRFRGTAYLHRQCVPLDEVDLRTPEERGQGSLFPDHLVDDGCDTGYCGR